MKKYHIITYGCQMNRSDSQRIASALENKGYQKARTPEWADLVIINMCSVRQKPVDKAINKIKNLKLKIKNCNSELRIIATGCILKQDKKTLEKFGIEIKKFKEIAKIKPVTGLVPITRGCNNFCSYCVVPYTRGKEKHRTQKQIIAEVKYLIKKGVKEITLLGQNVNSYPNFVKLLQKITALFGNFKVSFITNHPKDFSDELIKEMAQNPKIKKYVHLPFQSGDNAILKKMNRHYTRQDYLKLIAKIKKTIPNVEITTDIIVGFPGETKAQFQKTVEVVKKAGFKQMFIAKYSPRPGTAAFKLKDNVALAEKKQREQTLRKLITKGRPSLKRRSALRGLKLVVVLGPTASGKTSLSIKLAKKFNGEIISADSQQVYQKMDIGTGKITKKQMSGIAHYLLDVVAPRKKFSVAEYQKKAYQAINKIQAKNKTAFLVGGSPFYIYSIVQGWQFPEMKKDPNLRRQLEVKTTNKLFKMLKKLDPQRANTVEKDNKRRLVRAIEIAKTLGKVPALKKDPRYNCLLLGLMPNKQDLEKRAEQRIKQMLKQGLEKEVKALTDKYGFNQIFSASIDYKEWQPYFKNKISKQELTAQIKKNHLKLIKHQMTWFKKDQNIHWIKNQAQAEKLISNFLKE